MDVTRDEVASGAYKDQELIPQIAPAMVPSGLEKSLLEHAQQVYERAERRREIVDEKVKFLFNAIVFALPLTLGLASWAKLEVWLALPVALFLLAGVFLLAHFRVERIVRPTVSSTELASWSTESGVFRATASDLLIAANKNEQSTNFHVDLFRASLRVFSVAMLLTVLVSAVGIFKRRDDRAPKTDMNVNIQLANESQSTIK